MRLPLALAIPASTLIVGLLLAGCGGDDGPDQAEDEADIRAVLIENELGGPERCETIYTDDYLAENWNENVTAYPGDTPLEKCRSDTPLPGVGEEDIKVRVDSVSGDTAIAASKLRASPYVGFELVRAGDSWQIAGFPD